jgi:cbb3-type cytochrome oxidase maturation protein
MALAMALAMACLITPVVAAALGVFIWAVLSGQHDDVHTPAVRVLYDDESAGPSRQGS